MKMQSFFKNSNLNKNKTVQTINSQNISFARHKRVCSDRTTLYKRNIVFASPYPWYLDFNIFILYYKIIISSNWVQLTMLSLTKKVFMTRTNAEEAHDSLIQRNVGRNCLPSKAAVFSSYGNLYILNS